MSLLRFRRKSASASLRAQLNELFEQAPEGIGTIKPLMWRPIASSGE